MIQKLRAGIMAALFVFMIGGTVSTLAAPAPVYAAKGGDCNKTTFLTMPVWYRGLARGTEGGTCDILSPNDVGGVSAFVWRIVLNIIDILLSLVAYLSVGFIIFGGFKYILAAGTPDALAKAKTTITNAVIGLVLSLVAVAIVNVVSGLF